ncbi:MAG: tandem-95 repeat protein, partial [Rhodopirellula sp.]|nr:tandem-95 repeat protein [Rhodopirellula sp.]
TDPNDSPADNFLAVEIPSLPDAGSLTYNGTEATAGQFISLADLAAGKLVFTPAADVYGSSYAWFSFRIQDDGGTANGGVDLDPVAKTMTVNVTAVNDAPAGTSTTVTTLEDTAYVFTATAFGFTDPNDSPADNFLAVEITSLPDAGSLTYNGAAATAGQSISLADLAAGKLVFTPAADVYGSPYAWFSFRVQDDGGTADGGVDLDPVAKTMTVNVTAGNRPPVAVDDAAGTLQGIPVTVPVLTNDSDPDGEPLSISWFTQPGHGTVTDKGDGTLLYTPADDFIGDDSFSYAVSDGKGGADEAVVAVTVMPLRLVISAGSQAGDGSADTFHLVTNGEGIEVRVNGNVVFTTFVAIALELKITGSEDADTLIVDFRHPFTQDGAALFSFDGSAGRDEVHFLGAAGADTATLYPTHGTFSSEICSLDVVNVEAFDYDGGAGDTVAIWGSRENETYMAGPGWGLMTGENVSIDVTAETIYARGNGGSDTVYFTDSEGDDLLRYFPRWATMSGEGYFNQVNAFKVMYADAERGAGGTDTVIFRGT